MAYMQGVSFWNDEPAGPRVFFFFDISNAIRGRPFRSVRAGNRVDGVYGE